MKTKSIQEKAKHLKVKNYAKLEKDDLIWAIQKAEGHNSCYKKIPDCCQMDCCFRDDCVTTTCCC